MLKKKSDSQIIGAIRRHRYTATQLHSQRDRDAYMGVIKRYR